ncbi:MaoC/PaaZ C-terminal domain-containing protein [[Eubacterium] cellulosolvens]
MGYEMRGRYFEDFDVGDVIETPRRTVTEADVAAFAGISGDFNPLHTDEEFMKGTPFGGRIAHGLLSVSIGTGLINQMGVFEGTNLALLNMNIKFTGIVKFGDTIHLELKTKEKKETSKPGKGIITYDANVKNQKDETVVEMEWILMMKRKES